MRATCWFHGSASGDLLAEARGWRLRETGGALLGWTEGSDYVVARVLGPGPKAKHGFSSFEPDGPWQAEEGRRIYYESGRTIAYIGDWHSHPRGSGIPSSQDDKAAGQIAEDEGFRAPRPLSAIAVGPGLFRGRDQWSLNVFVWDGKSLVPIEVVLI